MNKFEALLKRKEEIQKTHTALYDENHELSAKLGVLLASHIQEIGLLSKIDWSVSVSLRGSITLSGRYYRGAGLELAELLAKIDASGAGGFYHFRFKLHSSKEEYITLDFNDGILDIRFDNIKLAKEFMGDYKINADGANELKLEISNKQQELDKLQLILKELG